MTAAAWPLRRVAVTVTATLDAAHTLDRVSAAEDAPHAHRYVVRLTFAAPAPDGWALDYRLAQRALELELEPLQGARRERALDLRAAWRGMGGCHVARYRDGRCDRWACECPRCALFFAAGPQIVPPRDRTPLRLP